MGEYEDTLIDVKKSLGLVPGFMEALPRARGLTKRTILHELYHHLIHVVGLNMTDTKEERAANSYARDFLS